MKNSNKRTTDSIQLSLIKYIAWGEKILLLHSSLLPTEGRVLGSVQLRGRAWHVSVAMTEGVGSPIPGSVDLGGHLSFFFSGKCFIYLGTFLPFEFETGRAHPNSKSGNYHILACLAEAMSS